MLGDITPFTASVRRLGAAVSSAGRRFKRDTRGATIILFALTLPISVALVGTAVHFARTNNAEIVLQASADTAALAAAKELFKGDLSDAEVIAYATRVFNENAVNEDALMEGAANVVFTIDRDEEIVTARARGTVKHLTPIFSQLDETTVPVVSQASFAIINVELSMALDVTGSMGGSKLDDLKDAATSIVDQLTDLNRRNMGQREGVRIALSPYAAAVNAGGLTSTVTGIPAGDLVSNCVTDRSNPRDTPPRRDPIPQDLRANCPTSEIVPLTKNANRLNNEIRSFRAAGCTAGHIGIEWAYYTLSPNWTGVFGGESRPLPYNVDETLKVAIIMTDGEFNTAYAGVAGDPTCSGVGRNRSEARARDLCGDMRRNDIRVYSVAFQAPTSAERLLRDCAGEDARYFEADTGNELKDAFEAIAAEVMNLRLTM
ncbi:MAG: pilus assembly protein TadG-related protein [Pseudomonadota bacterium]